MQTDAELLRRYVTEGSEPAFAELVRRYMGLVYSTNLRLVGGDGFLAQEVAQTVFINLSRKARNFSLRRPTLAGWLHNSTRFAAARAVRSERRRLAHEQEAVLMNESPPQAEPAWEELSPVLDEAVGQLSTLDREAVLLRFFQGLDLKSVGVALGLNEHAAQMRVKRALEKLRLLLARRGITSTAAGLATVIGARAVSAAPQNLAAEAIAAASASPAANAGFWTGLWASRVNRLAGLFVGVGACLVIVMGVLMPRWTEQNQAPLNSRVANDTLARTPTRVAATESAAPAANAPAAKPEPTAAETRWLRLAIVTADTGEAIPGIPVQYLCKEGSLRIDKDLTANQEGICDIPYSSATTRLDLWPHLEGFTERHLGWYCEIGDEIPAQYTLRLARAVALSGTVVDSEGRPVAGATVRFGVDSRFAPKHGPEDNYFSGIPVETDAQGRWTICRLSAELLPFATGGASHPQFPTTRIDLARDPGAEQQLRSGSFVFHLGPAATVEGRVVDSHGEPIAEAKVLVRSRTNSVSRTAVASVDGRFGVPGCQPGTNFLTAEAHGFAPKTQPVTLALPTTPYEVLLLPAKTVRLRVMDSGGQPIAGATVFYNSLRAGDVPVQVEYEAKTDGEGRAVWEDAPEGPLFFNVSAPEYRYVNNILVQPDGPEQVVTLPPALVVTGTVCDAANGQLVPQFRIRTGWRPSQSHGHAIGFINQFGNPVDYRQSAARTTFRYLDQEPLRSFNFPIALDYVVRVEAEGYLPFLSRPIRTNETKVWLEVALEKKGR